MWSEDKKILVSNSHFELEKSAFSILLVINVELLAFMCDADPECIAFNSNGELFRQGKVIVDPEMVLYQKRAWLWYFIVSFVRLFDWTFAFNQGEMISNAINEIEYTNA